VHRSNDRLDHDMAVIVEHRVPIVITSLGARPEINEAVHSYGGVVLHDVINDEFARKAVEKGADGIIAVAAGAGGHAGTQSPLALIREIASGSMDRCYCPVRSRTEARSSRLWPPVPISPTSGRRLSPQSKPTRQPTTKQMIVDSAAKDIIYSNLFTGVHGNYLRDSIVAAGLDRMICPNRVLGDELRQRRQHESQGWKDIWGSGQGIGAIKKSTTVAELVGQLKAQFDDALPSSEREHGDTRPLPGRPDSGWHHRQRRRSIAKYASTMRDWPVPGRSDNVATAP